MSSASRSAAPLWRVVVDGFGQDAVACAKLLVAEGNHVTMVGVGAATDEALALRGTGVTVCAHHAWDGSALADVVVVDCWTAETAPIVVRHRAAGAHVTSIGDLVVERCRGRTLGVTGSAGKTTATRLAAAMMQASGIDVRMSSSARAGNAWPAAEIVHGLPGPVAPGWLALELTSTHLAYMRTSPDVALITAFWPDHVELHGSLERYRQAKLTILRHQRPDDICVVNADDPGATMFAGEALGRVFEASAERPVASGVGTEGDLVVARLDDGVPVVLCRRDAIPLTVPLASVMVSAACAALVCGAEPTAVARAMSAPPSLPHRRQVLGHIDGVTVIDDSAATTPRKALGSLAGLDRSRLIVLVGGNLDAGGPPVLCSPEEGAGLADALDELATCRGVIAFGPAARRVPGTSRAATLEDAWAMAHRLARPGDVIVLAPMFPMAPQERAAFPRLAGLAG